MIQPNENNAKEIILAAAIECIEAEGLEKFTIRAVAQRAGVNVAAINYYFGSKDKLQNQALKRTLHEAFVKNINDYLGKDKISQADLVDFFAHNLEGMINYPQIVKAHFHDAFIYGNYQGQAMCRFHQFLETIQTKIVSLSDEKTKELQLSLIQIFSAVFMIGLFPGLYQKFASLDLKKESDRKKYLNHLLSHYLPKS